MGAQWGYSSYRLINPYPAMKSVGGDSHPMVADVAAAMKFECLLC